MQAIYVILYFLVVTLKNKKKQEKLFLIVYFNFSHIIPNILYTVKVCDKII